MYDRRSRHRIRVIATTVALALAIAGTGAFVMMALNATTPNATIGTFTASPIRKVFVPDLLVIGDAFSDGTGEGGLEENGWPALVQSGYTKDGSRLQLNLLARRGAGYVAPGQIKETFGQSYAGNAFKEQDVIVVFGGLSDSERPAAEVGAAATKLYAALTKNSPKAKLIVVGPAWPHPQPVPNIFSVRDEIRAAAEGAGAIFVDPLADGWFTGENASLIGKDQTHPTDAGHKYMAGVLSKPIIAAVKEAETANS